MLTLDGKLAAFKNIYRMSFCVYILTNPARTVLYIGVTNNLERRLYEHGEGLGDAGKFTGRYQCNQLVYFEIVPDATQAIMREKQLKKWSRSKKDWLINTLNPSWAPIDPLTWNG
ncbi:GIY-YIG nuclease family protein [Hymenobacter latericus]|uniref:GIY-YIG nuclease family protein n=1 Tax=Hymenobacter sp. YIM 151858-1 TaxID=2987688 RepID=UPI002226381B|nr:GIY-YIG nuclease family protein [Hymenobacter sp. YIM 151858-1]UYZ60264.1 GIY-YIG nuclease family protein [Hymenobacter sp. YIM 151858-1]